MFSATKLFMILLGGFFLVLTLLTYTGAQKSVFHYPEDRLQRHIVKNGYWNLRGYGGLTYEYDYELHYVEGHCPIPDTNYRGSDLVKTKDYIVVIYAKTIFGITLNKMYYDCGGGKFFHHKPKKEWNLGKSTINAAEQRDIEHE